MLCLAVVKTQVFFLERITLAHFLAMITSAGVGMKFFTLKSGGWESCVPMERAASEDVQREERKFWRGCFNWALGRK